MKLLRMRALKSPALQTVGTSWFSIVGAPRCGTTSLARYLSSHPRICFSSPKEPHFFSRQQLAGVSSLEASNLIRSEYLDRFFPNRPDDVVLAEGSVSYLYAPERMLPILMMWPDAQFIIAVRNPLEMLPSLHRRLLYIGDENVRDFATAWSLVEERRRGRHLPKSCLDPRLLDYKEIGQLGKHVRRFFEVVGRDRCFISVFDDLVDSPSEQHCQILDFLKLPRILPAEFQAHRVGMDVKVGWLQRLLKRPPSQLRAVFASHADLLRDGITSTSGLRAKSGVQRVMALRRRLLKWNRTVAPAGKVDPLIYSELSAWFRDDILELSALLGRDLRHWLERGEGTPS